MNSGFCPSIHKSLRMVLGRRKVVIVLAMKAGRESRGITPLVFDVATGCNSRNKPCLFTDAVLTE